MSYDYYANLIVIGEESELTLTSLRDDLLEFHKKQNNYNIRIDSNELLITINNNYTFRIIENNSDHVIIEAKECSDFTKKHTDKIAKCKKRFEMIGEQDLDLEYFNDSIYIYQCLEKYKNVFIFDPNNGTFLHDL